MHCDKPLTLHKKISAKARGSLKCKSNQGTLLVNLCKVLLLREGPNPHSLLWPMSPYLDSLYPCFAGLSLAIASPGMFFPPIPAWLPPSQLSYFPQKDRPLSSHPNENQYTCLTFSPLPVFFSSYHISRCSVLDLRLSYSLMMSSVCLHGGVNSLRAGIPPCLSLLCPQVLP